MTEQHFEGFDAAPEEGSRSARKREAQAIRKLVEEVADLGQQSFNALRIEEDVKAALIIARKLRPRSDERRRQLQYVARLQRGYPESDLEQQLRSLGASSKVDPKTMKLEKLRENLIANGKAAIDALCSLMNDIDRNKLRTLVKKAADELKVESDVQLPKPASRALYKFLKAEFERTGLEIPTRLV